MSSLVRSSPCHPTDFGDMGADELVFNPATDNLDDVARLAEIVF